MSRRTAGWMAGLLAVSLAVGWGANAFRPKSQESSRLAAMLPTVPPLEHFLSWDSFSEAEQTRAELEALCLHFIADARVRYIKSRTELPAGSSPEAVAKERGLDEAIQRLQRGIREFRGTDQVFLLEAELFRMLRRSGRDAEFVDHFLNLAYVRPTHEIVDSNAALAVEAAQRLGREAEVQAALAHRKAIPSPYRGALVNGNPFAVPRHHSPKDPESVAPGDRPRPDRPGRASSR